MGLSLWWVSRRLLRGLDRVFRGGLRKRNLSLLLCWLMGGGRVSGSIRSSWSVWNVLFLLSMRIWRRFVKLCRNGHLIEDYSNNKSNNNAKYSLYQKCSRLQAGQTKSKSKPQNQQIPHTPLPTQNPPQPNPKTPTPTPNPTPTPTPTPKTLHPRTKTNKANQPNNSYRNRCTNFRY